MLKRVSAPAALALSTGISAAVLANRAFSRLIRNDVQALLARAYQPAEPLVVTEQSLARLPEPIQRYLHYTGVSGKPVPRTVRLRQKGRMRTGPGQPWVPLDGEEYYSVHPPSFVWSGTMHAGPLPLGRARDMYRDGQGRMLVKVASLFTVVDASGQQMDQASMMRYLNEMMWFPSAFLRNNVSFESIDDASARVTLTDCGRTATAILYVDPEGRLIDFVAERYRTVAGASLLETWSTPIMAYGEFEGLRLPVGGKATWKLAGGDFDYFEVTVTELQYDVASNRRSPAVTPAGSAS